MKALVAERKLQYGLELHRRHVPSIVLSDGTEVVLAGSAREDEDDVRPEFYVARSIATAGAGRHSEAVDRRGDSMRARSKRDDLQEQQRRLETTSPEERLRQTIAWSAVLLADDLERAGGRRSPSPDPVGLGRRRA